MTKTNNNILNFFIAVAISFTALPAFAECDGFYIAGRAGYAEYEIEDDRSSVDQNISDYVVDKKRFIASGALGYRYEHFRAELEYVWRDKNSGNQADIADIKFSSSSYMFVVYYDFFPYSWFTPFVNAGIGWSDHDLTINNIYGKAPHKIDRTNFTWSLGAGISAKITNRWNLDVGYRYYDMGSLDVYNGDTNVTDQEIYVGLRYVL